MLKCKALKMVVLSFTLLMPYLASAEADNQIQLERPDIIEKSMRKHSVNSVNFRIEGLAGKWVFHASSVGGLSGAERIGSSRIFDGIIEFNENGIGRVIFGVETAYNGTPGRTITRHFPADATINVRVINFDHKFGFGNMLITAVTPRGEITDTIDFVAKKSAPGKGIDLILGHTTSAPGGPNSSFILDYTFERLLQ